MVTAFRNVTQADQNKEVQSVIEGDNLTTPTTYGVIPVNPAFVAVGPDGASLISSYAPIKIERRKTGNRDRVGKTTHKKKYTARLTFKASDNNVPLQKWCTNKSLITDLDTPAASRTFVQSYNVKGVQTYEILKGCHPTRVNIGVNKDGEIIYTVDLRVRERLESIATDGGITLSTGSFASPDTAAPFKADDGGLNHFVHNSIAYALDGMSIDIEHIYAVSNPTESQLDLYANESMRNVSGSVSVIKSDSVLLTDAFADTSRAMSLVLKAATTTLSWTNVLFENPSGIGFSPTDSGAFIETFNFEADTINLA